MKSRDEMSAKLLKATRLLHKEITNPVEWNRPDCRTTEKLERKIEIWKRAKACRRRLGAIRWKRPQNSPVADIRKLTMR
uniref:Uncharacterized protein n=1 Tax=Trichuris muris TaxID=70415 RepID=A0A5S6QAM0_TRIMR